MSDLDHRYPAIDEKKTFHEESSFLVDQFTLSLPWDRNFISQRELEQDFDSVEKI